MTLDEPDLGAYHRWLYTMAAEFLPEGYYDPAIDDLVQEGRIAMWKAYQSYDDCKGTLAPWLTNAARMRMKDIALGHGRYTGHTGRRGWTDAMHVRLDLPRPRCLEVLLEDPSFDQARLRMPVAASKVMTAANVRAWASSLERITMNNALDLAAQAALTPLKYAMTQQYPGELVGSYSRDRLTFTLSQDFGYSLDMYAGRFATRILAGKAYSEDYTVATEVPATWWQHLKLALYVVFAQQAHTWRNRFIPGFLPVWFPVRFEERKSTIKLTGHWSYPRADFITPHAGPVTVSEDIQVTGPHYELPAPSRFLSQGEIVREFYADPAYGTRLSAGGDATAVVYWLHRHGVNMDQLVPRSAL